MKLQVFDLDGTLVKVNSFHLWIRFLASVWLVRPDKLVRLGMILVRRTLKLINHSEMKYHILKLSQSITPIQLEQFCLQLEAHLHPEVLQRFRQAQADGCIACLNTAAPELYASLFGQRLGFDTVIATPQPGENWLENVGEQKVFRLKEHYPKAELDAMYSDEATDLPLLKLARQAVLVAPKPNDLQILRNHGIQPEILT